MNLHNKINMHLENRYGEFSFHAKFKIMLKSPCYIIITTQDRFTQQQIYMRIKQNGSLWEEKTPFILSNWLCNFNLIKLSSLNLV